MYTLLTSVVVQDHVTSMVTSLQGIEVHMHLDALSYS